MNKKLKIFLWIFTAVLVVVLMIVAKKLQEETILSKPEIEIEVEDENAFLTEDELYTRILRNRLFDNETKHKDLKIHEIENFIASMTEVFSVKVFTKIGQNWNIHVKLRRPIARIYNNHNESFYIDQTGYLMSPSDLYTARVVVVSGEIPDKRDVDNITDFINNDSLKSIKILDDIYRLSTYVCSDAFLRAQIGQIYRKKNGDFLLIPQVGSHTINFGTAKSEEEVKQKFEKLLIFYKEGLPYEGWNTYSEISLKYDNQIVCKKKD